MTAIETTRLTKRFGDLVAVDGLDLAVEEGEVFGFLGPNGAGKSTTINVLLGFLDPSDGGATVLGHDVETESIALRERLGVLPESYSPYDRLTAREHVEYAGGLKDCSPDTGALLDRVGLQRDAWDRPAGEFSTGMCQRLALALALVGDPDLLVLDEPSSGLDPEGMSEIRDLVLAEAASGTTVFFSSHILSEVEAVCDRVGILVDGDLAAVGGIDELRAAADTRVSMELAVEDLPDDLSTAVADIDGVHAATADDGTLAVELAGPEHKVDVIRHVDRRATVTDVVAEAASLDSMFEVYVNEGRRDGGATETGVADAEAEVPGE